MCIVANLKCGNQIEIIRRVDVIKKSKSRVDLSWEMYAVLTSSDGEAIALERNSSTASPALLISLSSLS